MEKDFAESELAPSPFRSYSVSQKDENDEPRTAKVEKRLIPKFPAFKRSSNKTTPFLLKRVSVSSELEKKFAPPIQPPVSADEVLQPVVISPISVRIPARPVVIPPVTVSRPVETFELPKVLSPTIADAVSPAPSAVTPAAAKISAVSPKISLEEINREFARTRTRAEKTRRRRFRSPLINGEIREELKDEYYWEILSDENETASKDRKEMRDDPLRNLPPRQSYGSGKAASLSGRSFEPSFSNALLVEPVIFVGHVTLLALSPLRYLWNRGEKDAAGSKTSRSRSRSQRNNGIRPIDFLIALVAGVVIAVVVVFPMLKKFGSGIYETVQKSNVRRFGGAISVSEDAPTLMQVLVNSPEIIDKLNESPAESPAPKSGEYSDIGLAEADPVLLPPQPWQDEPEPFDSAEWSGSLLNEFESPETESDRGGE